MTDLVLRLVEAPLQRRHVGFGQIHDVQVVPDAGAVWGVVVSAKHREGLADAGHGLGEERNQIVGHTQGQLPDVGGRMCADGVEVPKQGHMGRTASRRMVFQDALARLFGPAVRRLRPLERRRFSHGHVLRFPVDGAARGEHNVVHVVCAGHFEEHPKAAHVVGGVHRRFGHAFPHGFVRGEVQHADKVMPPEKPFQRRFVANVEGFKGNVVAHNGPDPVHSRGFGVVQVVHQHRHESRLVEGHGGVASDVACATCDEHLGS